jgi:hypothetical protein
VPGLLRGIGRTAVIAGTATAVSNRVSRRQADRWANQGDARYGAPPPQQAAPPPPPPPAVPPPDRLGQLRQLGELRDAGVLTETEFAAEKAKILGS